MAWANGMGLMLSKNLFQEEMKQRSPTQATREMDA